ncbi:hypothetical protein CHS0354_014776 [Potamilus streckersoni]|uniref:RanBP-type and C3HC4-type zinc finger-containing protein 1 n=1 Tax=Potamilus streckersoni TaxID=2493646 RepID=A0AAE0S7I1_9BIVA|nr:hypothetical protein CHS0354_014776 [Potamilus streckersoni]
MPLVAQAEKHRLEREQEESQRNFENLLEADEQDLIPNTTEFDCPVCFETIGPGGGVVLRECLHSFCKTCLMKAVQYTEEAILRCPFVDSSYSCEGVLQAREIKALVTEEEYDRFLQRSLMTAESQEANSFHCKTPDCRGWCIYEDHVNFFKCPVCSKENCLTCKAQHQFMNCKQYQEDIKRRATNDSAAKQTQLMIDQMMREGNAMRCPKCEVIVMKKDGCDWVKCSICKTEICWVTKGFRWGSLGFGDITGGCLCRVNGQKCHPNCNNCH